MRRPQERSPTKAAAFTRGKARTILGPHAAGAVAAADARRASSEGGAGHLYRRPQGSPLLTLMQSRDGEPGW